MKSEKTVAFIPSRLKSSRLPKKALLDICGLPMVVHVYRRCLLAESLDDVYVATDSEEIYRVVCESGGKAIMTSREHETGTDRIAEAATNIDCEIVVNVQGDEALVNPAHIDKVVSTLKGEKALGVAILVNPTTKYNNPSDIKTVVDEKGYVLYFSRSDIPSASRTPNPKMLKAYHIIPFRRDFLLKYASWDKGQLERIEYNEYLRILEKGYKIKTVEVDSSAISVDTKDDLEYVRKKMPEDILFTRYSATMGTSPSPTGYF